MRPHRGGAAYSGWPRAKCPAAAIATSNLANPQSAAANAVEVMADALGAITVSGNPAVEAVLSGSTGAIETAVAQPATATVASAARFVGGGLTFTVA